MPALLSSPQHASLLVAPLVASGALNDKEYPRTQLTPALGVQFAKGVNLKEILSLPQKEQDAVLLDLVILISQNGVVFFQEQDGIVPEDIGRLALRLGELAGKPQDSTLHIHPTQELSETGLPLGKIDSKPDKDGRQISFADRGLTSKGWHTDVAFEKKPALFSILQMHTLPPSGGDTLWHSNYHSYDALSPALARFLETLTATHDAERFREQSRINGFKLRTAPRGSPDNIGDDFQAVHPVIRTNQVTGLKALYVNTTFTKRINELSEDESRVLLDYFFKLQHESHEAHIKYKWSRFDLAIWSNSIVNQAVNPVVRSDPREGTSWDEANFRAPAGDARGSTTALHHHAIRPPTTPSTPSTNPMLPVKRVISSVLPRASPFALAGVGSTRLATTLGVGMERATPKTPTKYGGVYSVTLIPGDGVGKEITQSVEEIFEHVNVPVEFERFNISGDTSADAALFKSSMDSLRRNKVGLKGILYTPVSRSGHTSWNVAMRQQLDIYASVVLCKSVPGYPTRHKDVDFAIIRENTEGEYSGLEHQSVQGVVESLKIMTRFKSERIARFAFDFAIKNNRKTVTCVHKANIMKLGDGLFLNACRKVAEEYKDSGIKFNDMIVDNTSMQLVARPQQFDVMVMPNLYGSIVSNIGAALVGGPGIVPGVNIGREFALFEPGCRHVAKDIEGKDVANPAAMILSATMMLRHLGLDHQANQIAAAVYKVLGEGKIRTPDMGGKSGTSDMTFAVIKALS